MEFLDYGAGLAGIRGSKRAVVDELLQVGLYEFDRWAMTIGQNEAAFGYRSGHRGQPEKLLSWMNRQQRDWKTGL